MTVKQVYNAPNTKHTSSIRRFNNNNTTSCSISPKKIRDSCGCCCDTSIWRKAFKKCIGAMRQKLNVNRKMLSVVSAGAAAGMGGMDRLRGGGRAAARELAASRDRQVRLHAVRTDLALDLPPSIALPDGEDRRAAAAHARLHLRDTEQESEIYQKCIRPPPNRTVMDGESPPPYRSSSAGVLASSSSSTSSSTSSTGVGSDWSSGGSGGASCFVRCHSMSSTSSTSKTLGTSHHHHHHQHTPGGAQKTDFLQRTVKIFTGKKTTTTATSATSSVTSTTTAPCVIVPVTRQQQQQQPKKDGGGHKPPV
ncbi:uncharacterized protein LOC115889863 isoform X2 [Sitophilus oryzae]|uniref:Uncharacterized protein LOC115889863 isoform X2 n=1 Tax=Sitophilus oryzae TaxID=7048 RepID=A0A6J2YR93_SITOR|nr:uncharacterized protein LOC115889863 isoform X2 [Sitophilus oryzae]